MQASSGGSNPGTPVPAYSQCLELENKMLDSPSSCMHTTVISGSSRRQPVCAGPPPLIAPTISLPGTSSSTSGKRSRKNYVDPCVIAPLKKRRIQVGRREHATLDCTVSQAVASPPTNVHIGHMFNLILDKLLICFIVFFVSG